MNEEKSYLGALRYIKTCLIEIRNIILDVDEKAELPYFEEELLVIMSTSVRQSNWIRDAVCFMMTSIDIVMENMPDSGMRTKSMIADLFEMSNDLNDCESMRHAYFLYRLIPSEENMKVLIAELHNGKNNKLIREFPNDYFLIVASLSKLVFLDKDTQNMVNEIMMSASVML